MVAKRVLIVGGSFGGVAAAQALSRKHRVTVVDPGRFLEWLPNVHELVSGVKTPAALRADRRRLVERCGHRFLRSSIEELDPTRGKALTAGGRHLRFDACVVAVGGVNDDHGVRGADRNAMPFKSIDQCNRIGLSIARLCRSGASIHMTIVGGGLEGVEALGEVLRVHRSYEALSVNVVEGGGRMMPEAPAAVDTALRRHCEGLRVRFLTGARVGSVSPKGVRLTDGTRLRSDMTIWTGGVRPSPCLREWGLAHGDRDWAGVSDRLQSSHFENVFVVGDAAGLRRPIAKQAYHALDMGAAAAANLENWLRGKTLSRFAPAPKPALVAFGDLDTFLITRAHVAASPALAVVKEAIFQITMTKLDPPLGGPAIGALARRAAAVATRLGHAGIRPADILELLRVRIG